MIAVKNVYQFHKGLYVMKGPEFRAALLMPLFCALPPLRLPRDPPFRPLLVVSDLCSLLVRSFWLYILIPFAIEIRKDKRKVFLLGTSYTASNSKTAQILSLTIMIAKKNDSHKE